MIILINSFIIIFLILMFMMLMNLLISKKMFKNREKNLSFECGFDSQSMNRLPFSIQFYLISIIFLIFDVEISLILPMIKSLSFIIYLINLNSLLIILILLIGLFIEWKEGALKWFK